MGLNAAWFLMSLDENWFAESVRGYAVALALSQKLHEEASPYQTITVCKTKTFGHLMTLDGRVMLTSRNNIFQRCVKANDDPRATLLFADGAAETKFGPILRCRYA